MYDISNEQSFRNCSHHWMKLIKSCARPLPLLIALVGNKIDLESDRKITLSAALRYANEEQCLFHELSALNGFNVTQLFHLLAQQLIAVYKRRSQL